MSLNTYSILQSHTHTAPDFVGVELPTLIQSNLTLSHEYCNFDQLCSKIHTFQPQQGWAMYRDSVTISSNVPSRNDLIEAEYSRGEESLQIRLIGPEHYSVCKMAMNPTPNSHMVYKEQSILVQKHFNGVKAITYRLWYQQHINGENSGRWEAFVQQFIGFSQQEEK
ncbi:hypothetical protein H5200_02495 [Pseudoalteromonas sp. SG43-7]|uniref:hypothetical protein n=1 Tax=Pseudoalteromonas sp. SG43-7 TaxID=2760966 RepID=UPI001600AE3D|nr:hypothetical protein [Pseudoalteromonas sp. SG43-7]MBB1420787.1 hypothetical protein [Pseudoalteromonas sp. SG43-7]